jgi:hypothetical protein
MKNIGNTENNDQDLTVQNNLTVGNDISANGITTATLGASGITTQTLIASENISIPTFGSINFGINPFKYERGSWTPAQSTLKIIGLGPSCENVDWFEPRNVIGVGSYVRVGSLVTVYYETSVTFDGTNNDSLSFRTPVIQGLPFRCRDTVILAKAAMSGVMDAVTFPNGYVAGLAAPLAVTMDGGYEATVLEVGSTFESREPPIYNNPITWPTDGRTIFLTCSQSQYTLIGALAWTGLEGHVYNANVIFTGTGYISRFQGSLTYFTDE